MESAKLRKKLLSAFLALTFSAVDPFLRLAEAGLVSDLESYRNKLTALTPERGAAIGFEYLLLNVEKDITKHMQDILAEAERRDWTEVQPEYENDHAALKDAVWKDVAPDVSAIYGALLAAEKAFSDPGYRIPAAGETIRFSQIYKDRVGQWMTYALVAVAANNTQTGDAVSVQATIKSLHDASLAAGGSGGGYRQLLQSRHQTANFMNQEISKLRTDIQRQIDAETRIALNERQERTDRQAAFEQAVSRWKDQTQGKEY
jgi:hypothetical protein